MDPVVTPLALAAGTALVSSIAEDGWQQAKDAVVALWRRVHPQRAEGVDAELAVLREEVLTARDDGDTAFEAALTASWQARLQRLLREEPELAVELQRILATVLSPAAPRDEQAAFHNLTGTATGRATLNLAGSESNIVVGDQYRAGRDLHLQRPGHER